jgi:hypothetical protein
MAHTLQRHNTEKLKQILPEKELHGLSPNFHIHVSVRDLYFPRIGLPILLRKICGPILGIRIYKSFTDTLMWKLGLDRAIRFLGIHKWDFRCSAEKENKFNVLAGCSL